MRILLSFLLALHLLSVSAQTGKDSLMRAYMLKTKELLGQKNYQAANSYLLQIFSLRTTLPDDVAFLYGEAQLGLKNYVRAREAFDKYLDLRDSTGQYSRQARELRTEAEKNICKKCDNTGVVEVKDSCNNCSGKGKLESMCEACRGKGHLVCYTCRGKGVETIVGPFGASYQTCSVCKGKGLSVCTSCNGAGYKQKFCEVCKGKGYFEHKEVCPHY